MTARPIYDELPTHRLGKLQDPSKIPLVLVAPGSFSPLTHLHLRMFELARDHVRGRTLQDDGDADTDSAFEVVGGYLSPVNDRYNKPRLASATDRLNMCEAACKEDSDWIAVDRWEACQENFVPTARVLDHLWDEINVVRGGIEVVGRKDRVPARIILLAGSDLVQTMSQPGVWQEKDLHHILSRYGLYVCTRSESTIDWSLFQTSGIHSRSPLALYRDRIYTVEQPIRNDVSSTKVRLLLDKCQSVEYLVPGAVSKYINSNALYQTRRPRGRQAASSTSGQQDSGRRAPSSSANRSTPTASTSARPMDDAIPQAGPSTYVFPTGRLNRLRDPRRTPLVLIACGSFSPVTYLHLRMFEMARDFVREDREAKFEVVGGYFSPVNDAYNKKGLAPAVHRLNMCQLACNKTSDWISVDSWEADRDDYLPTAQVLDHFDHAINEVLQGVEVDGEEDEEGRPVRRRVRIVLLAGSDLIQTMSEPGVWADKDLHHILGRYGCMIIERPESHIDWSLFETSPVHSRSPLALYKDQIYKVTQLVRNDVSSTKVRLFLRRGMSVEYLIPSIVVKYIRRHGLYVDEDVASGPSPFAEAKVPQTAPPTPAADRTGFTQQQPSPTKRTQSGTMLVDGENDLGEGDDEDEEGFNWQAGEERIRPPPPTSLASRPP